MGSETATRGFLPFHPPEAAARVGMDTRKQWHNMTRCFFNIKDSLKGLVALPGCHTSNREPLGHMENLKIVVKTGVRFNNV